MRMWETIKGIGISAYYLILIAIFSLPFSIPAFLVIHSCLPSEEKRIKKMEREIVELYDQRNFYLAWIETEPPSEVRAILLEGLQDFVQETDAKLAKYPEAIRMRVWKQNEDVLQKSYQFYLDLLRATKPSTDYDYRVDVDKYYSEVQTKGGR